MYINNIYIILLEVCQSNSDTGFFVFQCLYDYVMPLELENFNKVV